jgi:polar amino acid transport system substrate-binding protein
MKNTLLRYCCRHLLAVVFFCTPLLAQASEITITYADYKPYSFEAAGKPVGLEIDLLNEALGKRMGLTLRHQILPWERAQQMVKAGVADGYVATITEERTKYADASHEAVTFWELALYSRKGDPRFNNIKTLEALAPFKIGTLNGNGWVKKNLQGMQIEYVNKMALLPKMLQAKRIDVIPDDRLVMRDLLSTSDAAAHIDEHLLDFTRNGMHLLIGKTSPLHARLAEFDAVLLQMKKDGSWQRIHDKYLGTPP